MVSSKKKKKLDKIKTSSMWSLGFGNRWSKYETKRPKNLTMLCTIHIIRGNKVITVLLVKLLGCQITSKHPFFCKKWSLYVAFSESAKIFGILNKFSDFYASKECHFWLKSTKMSNFSSLEYQILSKIHLPKFAHMQIDLSNIFAQFCKKIFFSNVSLCHSMIVSIFVILFFEFFTFKGRNIDRNSFSQVFTYGKRFYRYFCNFLSKKFFLRTLLNLF